MSRSPLIAVPAPRSSMPVLAVRRRLVLGLLIASVLLSVGSAGAWISDQRNKPVIPVLANQDAVGLAQTAVGDFLASQPSAVPAIGGVVTDFGKLTRESTAAGGKPVGPLSVSGLSYVGSTLSTLGDGSKDLRTMEQERFVATVAGQLMEVNVPMIKTAGGWALGAAPSMVPAVPGDGADVTLDYAVMYKAGGDSSLLPSPTYAAQVGAWAKTFVGAGPADPKLYALTGDTSANTYSGLSQVPPAAPWTLVGVPVIGSVVSIATPHPGFIIQTSLVLRAPGANGPTLQADYDLYVRSDQSQSQPPVVAWGPAGSYKTLNPFVNADQR